jgi:hypothetical protein
MANDPSKISLTGKVPIEVFGTDLDGLQFIEQSRTLSITRDGAIIPLTNKLAPESELIVRNPATNQEALARVVDLVRDEVYVRVYGIAFVNESVNLWQSECAEMRPNKPIVMECSRCHEVHATLLGDIELEILESKQSLTRHCECSNSSTLWRQTGRTVTETSVEEPKPTDRKRQSPALDELAERAAAERRRQKRTPMKTSAYIRRYGGEEIVECEDVSRGGFRFKSRQAYPVGSLIQAAVLYTKGSGDIFVAGRIAYQQKLDGGFYRHGVAYVESVK